MVRSVHVRKIDLPYWAQDMIKKKNAKNANQSSSPSPGKRSYGKSSTGKNATISANNTAHLIRDLLALGCPAPVLEHHFRADRRWAFDLCWELYGVAVEIEGGAYTMGRHTRGTGFEEDCHKYNTATAMGWSIVRVTTGMIRDGSAATYTAEALRVSGCPGIAAQRFKWEKDG